MTNRLVSVCGWIVACGLLAGAACPAPDHNSFIGVHGSADDPANGLNIMEAAGFKWIRVQIPWLQVEPADNSFNWDILDIRVLNAGIRGFSIVMYFQNVPTWANGNAGPNTPPTNANRDKFGEFLQAVIQHQLPGNPQVNSWPAGRQVGEVVARYELWNEPNVNTFWNGSQDVWKDRILRPGLNATIAMRQAGFLPVKALAPSTYINYDRGASPDLSSWTSGHLCDITDVSVHAYGDRATQLQEMGDVNSWCGGQNCCASFEVTEGGFDSSSPCEQDSCDPHPGAALLATQNRCLNLQNCNGAFIFNLYDVAAGMGLLTGTVSSGPNNVRDRLCQLEASYGPPLAVAAPCPCPGQQGCANEE